MKNKTCKIRKITEKNPIGCLREPGWREPTEIPHHCSTAVYVKVISVNWPLSKGSLAQRTHFEEGGSLLLGPALRQEFPQLLLHIFLLWLNNIHRMDDPPVKLQQDITDVSRLSGALQSLFLRSLSPVLCLKAVLGVSRVHVKAPLWDKSRHVTDSRHVIFSSQSALSLSRLQPQHQGKTTASLTQTQRKSLPKNPAFNQIRGSV